LQQATTRQTLRTLRTTITIDLIPAADHFRRAVAIATAGGTRTVTVSLTRHVTVEEKRAFLLAAAARVTFEIVVAKVLLHFLAM